MTQPRILCTLAILAASGTAWAQTHQVEVKEGTVVYASGNDLVVKAKDGRVRHYVVPADFRFQIDGKDVATNDLKPGTHLTQTITTTTRDNTVTSVRNIDVKVWKVNAPYVIVRLADGTNKQVKVPDGTKFTIDGQQKTVFDLREGMNLKGTIVTETPETIVSSSSKVVGAAPPKRVDTPEYVGVLLIEEEEIPAPR